MAEVGRLSTAEEQLAAIANLSAVLDQHQVDYWLFGGWAVDFFVGAVTRSHDDIDVAAWRLDQDTIKEALEGAGWRLAPAARDTVGARYQFGSALVEFTFVVADADGSVVVLLPDQSAVWSTQPFGDVHRELLGVTSRTIPLELLRTGKSVPREDDAEAAKDRADFQALSKLDA